MPYTIKAGSRIRLNIYMFGNIIGTEDYTVEEFRFCLGIFESDEHRKASKFTPLCELYTCGPNSEADYIPNFGEYITNQVPSWMDIP